MINQYPSAIRQKIENLQMVWYEQERLIKLKQRLWWRLGNKKEERQKCDNKIRDEVERERRLIKKDHNKQVREIRIEMKKKSNDKNRIIPKELKRYSSAKVFQEDARRLFKPGEVMGPVTVGLEDNLLDMEEVAVLKRGPKFCCRRMLSKERFLIEMEKCFCKIRWSERDKDPNDKEDQKHETEEEKQ